MERLRDFTRDFTGSLQDRVAHLIAGGRLGARRGDPVAAPELVICDFGDACTRAVEFDAVISIESPRTTPLTGRLRRLGAAGEPAHKVLRFYDIDDPRQPSPPRQHHVRAGLAFARRHAGGRLLVHCFAGISRSTALAYAILIDRHHAVGDEPAMLERILALRPHAAPNRLMVRYADRLLGCDGRMIKAVDEHPVIRASRARYAAPPPPASPPPA